MAQYLELRSLHANLHWPLTKARVETMPILLRPSGSEQAQRLVRMMRPQLPKRGPGNESDSLRTKMTKGWRVDI